MTSLPEPVKATTGETLLTKTSLAHHHEVNSVAEYVMCFANLNVFVPETQEVKHAGTAHNTKAAPFPASVKVFQQGLINVSYYLTSYPRKKQRL